MISSRAVALRNAGRHVATARGFASVSAIQHGRFNLNTKSFELQRHTVLSSSQSFVPFASLIFQPSGRSLHTFRPLYQQKPVQDDVKEPPKTEGEEKKTSDTEGEKKEGEAEGETKKEDGEGKDEKKEKPPPPPPHGDKTPWQVFTETLRTEFKASKEWNESTKQLASSAQEFTESESVRKARAAYDATAGAATTKGAQAIKTGARAIGQGAAWTWDTNVVQGVRKGVNAAGRGIEKATRPVRETKAFKEVKEAIDDGSSSRYGGWTEKEERRKRREARELKDIKEGRRPLEKMEEDPK